jgi:hypothetical protein
VGKAFVKLLLETPRRKLNKKIDIWKTGCEDGSGLNWLRIASNVRYLY